MLTTLTIHDIIRYKEKQKQKTYLENLIKNNSKKVLTKKVYHAIIRYKQNHLHSYRKGEKTMLKQNEQNTLRNEIFTELQSHINDGNVTALTGYDCEGQSSDGLS